MTTSSLLTLDNARMRFGIVLAQSQPSVKVVHITDRDRARNREAVRDKEERLVVRTDTVYIEKRDSSLRVLGRAKRQSRAKAYGLQETRDTVREQVMVAVHDTIRELTTITVQTNDAGD